LSRAEEVEEGDPGRRDRAAWLRIGTEVRTRATERGTSKDYTGDPFLVNMKRKGDSRRKTADAHAAFIKWINEMELERREGDEFIRWTSLESKVMGYKDDLKMQKATADGSLPFESNRQRAQSGKRSRLELGRWDLLTQPPRSENFESKEEAGKAASGPKSVLPKNEKERNRSSDGGDSSWSVEVTAWGGRAKKHKSLLALSVKGKRLVHHWKKIPRKTGNPHADRWLLHWGMDGCRV